MSSVGLAGNRALPDDWAIDAPAPWRTKPISAHVICALEDDEYSWASELQERIASFAWLRPDWDHEGAEAVNLLAIERALRLLPQLDRSGLPRPTATPTQAGGVAIEWSTTDLELEIEFQGAESTNLYYLNKVTKDEWEGAAEDSPIRVERLLASIVLPSGDPFAKRRA